MFPKETIDMFYQHCMKESLSEVESFSIQDEFHRQLNIFESYRFNPVVMFANRNTFRKIIGEGAYYDLGISVLHMKYINEGEPYYFFGIQIEQKQLPEDNFYLVAQASNQYKYKRISWSLKHKELYDKIDATKEVLKECDELLEEE